MSHRLKFEEIREVVNAHSEVLREFRLRTVTLGINLLDCVDNDLSSMRAAIGREFDSCLPRFSNVLDAVMTELQGVLGPVPLLQTRRVTITPLELLGRSFVKSARAVGMSPTDISAGLVDLAKFIDEQVRRHLGNEGVFLGGAGFLAEKGVNIQREIYFDALPEVLRQTRVFNASINVGSTSTGIDLEAVRTASRVIRMLAESDIATSRSRMPVGGRPCWDSPAEEKMFNEKRRDILARNPGAEVLPFWSNLARLAVFVNAPPDNPFMAGGFHGPSEPEFSVSVGINGAGVIQKAIEVANPSDLTDVIRSIRYYAGLMYRIAEAIRFEVIRRLRNLALDIDDKDGVVDLSIASTDDRDEKGHPRNSIAQALSNLGIAPGGHGTLAGLGLIIDSAKKAGADWVCYPGGLSGTFIPVSEDAGMADAAAAGYLTYDRYLAMTSVCSVGVDMVPIWIPDGTDPQALEAVVGGMILDEAAIGVYTNKTTSVRLLAVHYEPRPNRFVVLLGGAGLLGASPIFDVGIGRVPPPSCLLSERQRGRIPGPLTSLRN